MKKARFYTRCREGLVEQQGWKETIRTEQNEDITFVLYDIGDEKEHDWCVVEATTGLAVVYGKTRQGALRNALVTLLDVAKQQNTTINGFLAQYPKMEVKNG